MRVDEEILKDTPGTDRTNGVDAPITATAAATTTPAPTTRPRRDGRPRRSKSSMDCPNLGDDSLANTAERRRMFGLATRIPYLCSMPLEHPGVHVPPPLLYAAGFLAGWLVDRLHPLRMTTTLGNGRVIIAGVCFVIWLALMLA